MKLVGLTQEQVDADKAEEARLAEIAELEQYLSGTDWYDIRSIKGKPAPTDVTEKREAARERISELRAKE